MEKEIIGDVWSFETPMEEIAIDELNFLYKQARGTEKGSVSARNLLKKVFEDSWKTIKKRFETEGSVWYVWYMDGVRNFIMMQK
jgi:hypothetical protein